MPVRIYDIAKRLGIESWQILAIAKELGIKEAKVPSSSLDKITAEFLEEKLGPLNPATSPGVEAPIVIIKAPEPERQPFDVLADPLAPLAEQSSPTPAQPPKTITTQLVGRIDLSKFGARRETAPATGQQQHGSAAATPAPNPVDPYATLPASAQVITMKPPLVVRDLAEQMRRKPFQIIADLLQMGIYANVNQAIDGPIAIKVCAKHGFKLEVGRVTEAASVHPTQAPLAATPVAASETPDLTITLQLAGPGAKEFMERLKAGKIQLEVGLGLPGGGLGAKKLLLPLAPEAFLASRQQQRELAERPLTMEDAAKLRAAYGAASQFEGSEFVTLARLGDILRKLHPEFLPSQYGKESLSELVKAQNHLFEVQENRKLTPPVLMVRLKASNSVQATQPTFTSKTLEINTIKRPEAIPLESIGSKYSVGTKVKGKVVNLVHYGAFIELEPGVEGLVHVTELSWTTRIAKPSDVLKVGQEVEAVVLGINREDQRISLGIRQLDSNPWEAAHAKYPPGTKIKGKVRNLTSYGAFVELEEGLDGMVHVSDISWTRKINHPSEVFQKGDEVEAVVLEVDKVNQRISLGMKQLGTDPWLAIDQFYEVGDLVTGKVTKLSSFGVFIGLTHDIDGMMHVSDISWTRKFDHPSEVFQEGDEVEAVVLEIDKVNRRIALGMKKIEPQPSSTERKFGRIQLIRLGLNYGFIRDDEAVGLADRRDLFFHASALEGSAFRELQVGDAVTFEVEKSERGLQACKVQKLTDRY